MRNGILSVLCSIYDTWILKHLEECLVDVSCVCWSNSSWRSLQSPDWPVKWLVSVAESAVYFNTSAIKRLHMIGSFHSFIFSKWLFFWSELQRSLSWKHWEKGSNTHYAHTLRHSFRPSSNYEQPIHHWRVFGWWEETREPRGNL